MHLIEEYGTFWTKNPQNMKKYRTLVRSKNSGVYVLYNGSAPVYVGRGQIKRRVSKRNREGSSKSRYWDHFSWFLVDNEDIERELEALLLKILPFYLRCLNRQKAQFLKATRQNKKDIIRLKLPGSLSDRTKLRRSK